MKLDIRKGKASGGNIMQTEAFGVGDIGVIMEILRSKLYSKPIKVICQEIPSNARDAHREVGCADRPIEIQLPNRWDMTYHVRDFGPGITPDRMSDVFIQYGNSTKRADNVQNGGFGIGAKCPWSYVDIFTIISITPDDDGKMIRRQYIAEVSSSNEGTLRLLTEAETDEPQGTEIIVSCKEGDIHEFRRWTIEACQFWSVKPVIKGGDGDFDWPEIEKQFEGDGWFVLKGSSGYNTVQPRVLIDEIPYALNFDNLRLDELDKDIYEILNQVFRYHVYLTCGIGDIPVAASREEIDYTDKAIKSIQESLVKLANEIVEEISETIASCDSLWDANLQWRQIDHKYRTLVQKAVWNGHVVDGNISFGRNSKLRVFTYTRNEGRYDSIPDPGAFRSIGSSTSYEIRTGLMVLYTKENFANNPNRRRLRTVFLDHQDVDRVVVVALPYIDADQTDPQVLKDRKEKRKEAEEKVDELIDLYEIGCFEDYEKAKIVRQKNGMGKTPKSWVFNVKGGWSNRSCWDKKPVDIADGTGVYVLLNRKVPYFATNDAKMDSYTLKEVLKQFDDGMELIGISKRQKSKIGPGWVPLEYWMKNKLLELYQDPDYTLSLRLKNPSAGMANGNLPHVWDKLHKRLSAFHNQSGLFANYVRLSGVIDNGNSVAICNVIAHWKRIFSYARMSVPAEPTVDNCVDMVEMKSEVYKAYPLLPHLSYGVNPESIIDYINMVDRQRAMSGMDFA